jgi:hypothetical protein
MGLRVHGNIQMEMLRSKRGLVYFARLFCGLIRARRSAIIGLLTTLLSLSSQTATAQDWEHLPDGRVVIDIKGHRLTFPSTGFDLNHVRFNDESLKDRATLRHVIESPDKERERFLPKEKA